MNTLRRRRSPAAEFEAAAQPGAEQVPRELQAHWTGGAALATKACTGLLWTGLICGPLALLLAAGAAFSSTAPAVRELAPVVDRSGEQAAASEFAGRVVTLWLTSVRGQEAQLALVLPGVPVTLPELAWTVGAPSTADVQRQPDGTWLVVTAVPVGASAGPAQPGLAVTAATAPPPVRYFALPVRLEPDGLVALTLPTPVPAPAVAPTAVRLDYRYRAAQNDPLATSAQEFLDALLTGAGDVTRYVSPGTLFTPISPPPYTAVAVTDVATDQELPAGAAIPADGSRLRALVNATATDAPGQQTAMQYPLTLTVRGGRWEVTAIDPAPALPPSPPPTSASRTATPGSTAVTPTTTPPTSVPAPATPTTTPADPLD